VTAAARIVVAHLEGSMSSEMPHVTLTGDVAGEYLIREERPDGTLVLAPETAAQASLRRLGARAATPAEFDAFVAEHSGQLLPSDGEG